MTDWAGVALRFAVYADLLLLFGLAVRPLRQSGEQLTARIGRAVLLLALVGLPLQGLAFVQSVADMSGTTIGGIDRETFNFVLRETPSGTAFLVRSAALALTIVAALMMRRRLLALGPAVALATLAWNGHAAVSEGGAGMVHRGADILHLLAAGAWVGALALLIVLVGRAHTDRSELDAAHHALSGFATTGSVIVGVIVATGAVNAWMIVGPAKLLTLPTTLYGQLLLAKVAAFLAMLAIASANRWWLTPRLARSEEVAPAARALRISIGVETVAAVVVIALVSWFGTIDPS